MAIYSVNNTLVASQQNQSSSYKTALSVNAATGATTLRRVWLYEFEVGADNVPNATDCSINWNIAVMTVAGTGSAATPNVIDIGGGDAAALATYTINYTVEPTISLPGSSLFYLPLNQRASQRIIFKDMQSSIICPAVNAKGPAIMAKSTNYASTVGVTAFVQE